MKLFELMIRYKSYLLLDQDHISVTAGSNRAQSNIPSSEHEGCYTMNYGLSIVPVNIVAKHSTVVKVFLVTLWFSLP